MPMTREEFEDLKRDIYLKTALGSLETAFSGGLLGVAWQKAHRLLDTAAMYGRAFNEAMKLKQKMPAGAHLAPDPRELLENWANLSVAGQEVAKKLHKITPLIVIPAVLKETTILAKALTKAKRMNKQQKRALAKTLLRSAITTGGVAAGTLLAMRGLARRNPMSIVLGITSGAAAPFFAAYGLRG